VLQRRYELQATRIFVCRQKSPVIMETQLRHVLKHTISTVSSVLWARNKKTRTLFQWSRPLNIYLRSILIFEVLTAVVVNNTIFWDITPCSPLRVDRRFGGTYRLHVQGREISRARKRENRWEAEKAVVEFKTSIRSWTPLSKLFLVRRPSFILPFDAVWLLAKSWNKPQSHKNR
jgi:hypothetical protein